MIIRVLIFLLINFGGLAIGGLFTGSGVASEWYKSLNQAPWTPPGWVFGFAWTFIMICFSVYMAKLADTTRLNDWLRLFALQVVLNVGWNPVFFYFHKTGLGLIIISLLTIVIVAFMLKWHVQLKYFTWLLVPYFLWLCIATWLNAYIYFRN